MSEDEPSLYEGIRRRVLAYAEPRKADHEGVSDTALKRRVAVPQWYERGAYDIGVTMRTIGYYRHGDVWRYGVKPEKRKKVERWKLPGRSDLKTLRLDQVAKLHTMAEDELKRRGR